MKPLLVKCMKWLAVLLCSATTAVAVLVGLATMNFKKQTEVVYDLPPLNIVEEIKIADIHLGERIARVRNGCVDCHGNNFAGRPVIDDPLFGKMGGSNLTPSSLGQLSDEELASAIHYGINRHKKPLVFMPSHEYQNLSKKDLAAVIAFLRTLPAVDTPSPEVNLGPLPKVLYFLGKLPTLLPVEVVNKTQALPEKPEEQADAKFGKYLATASCIGCHGPTLAGGPIPGGPPSWAPASDIRGAVINKWTEEQFIQTMKTGVNPNGQKLRAPMPISATSQMSETELKALYAYLQTAGDEIAAREN